MTMNENNTNNKPLVVIRCITYNHEPYIRDALEGFVTQKTNFPFIAIVHDDASTDGTAAIIREYAEKYPDIIKSIFETENQYSKNDGSLIKIMYDACKATGAKYIAFCEGDDYWKDPLKLQKQVDYLKHHDECSACITKCVTYNESTKKFLNILGSDYQSLKDLLWRDFQFSTASLVVRSSLYYQYIIDIKPQTRGWLMGDKPLLLYMGAKGRVKTLKDCTVVYRILENSASHSSNIKLQLKRARNTIDIYHFFAQKYLPNDQNLRLQIEGGYLYRAYLIYKRNNKEIPEYLKQDILSYRGQYRKVNIVKVFLRFPPLANISYMLAKAGRKFLFLLESYIKNTH